MKVDKGSSVCTYYGKSRVYENIFDSIALGSGLWLAIYGYGMYWEDRFLWVLILSYALFMILAEFNEVYVNNNPSSILRKVPLVLLCWVAVILSFMLINLLFKTGINMPPSVFIFWCIITAMGLIAWRLSAYVIINILGIFISPNRTVAIAGETDLAVKFANTIRKEKWRGEQLVGIYDDRALSKVRVHHPEGVDYLGNFDDMISDAHSQKLDVIYLALPLRAENRMFELAQKLADTTTSVYIVPDFSPFNLLNSRWTTVNDIPLVSIYESPFIKCYYSIDNLMKRALDIIAGFALLIIFFIPMIIIAIGIKLLSPGPVIFKQVRYGIDGSKIMIWKFRSMYVCESGEESVQAKQNDPRITHLGRYLRKYSLDELPQLFNVLAGNMSIVGPRPHSVARNEQYRRRIQGYMLRHKVKPGLTGWAQVCGLRGETDTLEKMEKRFQHDFKYIQNWSLYLDLKIIILTVLRNAWIEQPTG